MTNSIVWQNFIINNNYSYKQIKQLKITLSCNVMLELKVNTFKKSTEMEVLEKFYFYKNLLKDVFSNSFCNFNFYYFFIKKEGKKIKNLRKRRNIHFCLLLTKKNLLLDSMIDIFFTKLIYYSILLEEIKRNYGVKAGVFMQKKSVLEIRFLIFNINFLFGFVADKVITGHDNIIKLNLQFKNKNIAEKFWYYLSSKGIKNYNEKT